MCQCEQKNRDEVKEILKQYTEDKDNLIQVLNEIQEKYGYIPKFAQIEISEYLKISMAEVYGVITFYSRFTLEPKGKHSVSICLGTACYVKGSEKLLDRAKQLLGISEGQTTKDRTIFHRYDKMHWSLWISTCIYCKW